MSSKNKFKKTHNSIEEDSDDSYYRDDDSDHMEISSSANSGIEPTSEDVRHSLYLSCIKLRDTS